MEFKGLLLLSMLIGVSYGQNLTCQYADISISGETHYGCHLTIINPDGLDDFTTILGEHQEGRTDADVTAIIRDSLESDTINFPQIICSQFANLRAVDYSWLGLTEVSETAFSGCPNLEWLRLWLNNIEQIHENAFANNGKLKYLDIDSNRIESLPENVFSNLEDLENLEMSFNAFSSLPAGIFRNLRSLNRLYMSWNALEELNSQWFESLEGLQQLYIYNNPINTLDENAFANLRNLEVLDMAGMFVTSLPTGIFSSLTNLQQLFMGSLLITEVNPEWFSNLNALRILDISDSHLPDAAIPAETFSGLTSLEQLDLSRNLIMNLNPAWFAELAELKRLNLDHNQVQALPNGVFEPITALTRLDMWANNVKTIRREAFGNITSLDAVDFDENVINAIDERFLREAEPLLSLYLWGNLCTGERFYNFAENRQTFLPRLAQCVSNFRFIIDTETVAGEEYVFFDGMSPGIQFRVNSESSVSVALTSFDVPWNPMLEVVIGTNNNSISQIIRNQEQVVVNVPTPNILRSGESSGFRITWSNHVIMVTREDQAYPFMAYTKEDFYAINFYGIKSSDTDAVWSIQPVESEIAPTKH